MGRRRVLASVIAFCIGPLLALLCNPCAAGLEAAQRAFTRGEYASAYREYRPLAEAGIIEAQIRLAGLYREGLGTIRDEEAARRWYERAAQQGSLAAQLALARLYREARSALADDLLAYVWFNVAASQGAEEAIKMREIVAASLQGEQISRGQQLAREYFEQFVMPYRPSAAVAAEGDGVDATNEGAQACHELKGRYRRLRHEQGIAVGREVVVVTYDRQQGADRLAIRLPGEPQDRPVSAAALHRHLRRLYDRYPQRLYVQVVIPAGSGLSYDEARSFIDHLLENYDADFRPSPAGQEPSSHGRPLAG